MLGRLDRVAVIGTALRNNVDEAERHTVKVAPLVIDAGLTKYAVVGAPEARC